MPVDQRMPKQRGYLYSHTQCNFLQHFLCSIPPRNPCHGMAAAPGSLLNSRSSLLPSCLLHLLCSLLGGSAWLCPCDLIKPISISLFPLFAPIQWSLVSRLRMEGEAPNMSSCLLQMHESAEFSCSCGLQSSSVTVTWLFPTGVHPGPPGQLYQTLWEASGSPCSAGSERGWASLSERCLLSWASWPKPLYSTFSSSETQRHSWQGPVPRWGVLGPGLFSRQNFLERWCPNHHPVALQHPAPRTSVVYVPGASWGSQLVALLVTLSALPSRTVSLKDKQWKEQENLCTRSASQPPAGLPACLSAA